MSIRVPGGRRRRLLTGSINLTPLLDAILNLVFFFLIATTIKQPTARMEVNLPTAGSATPSEPDKRPSVTLLEDGKLYFNGSEISEAEFEIHARELAAEGRTEMDIRGDSKADFGRVVRLMDICKSAGLAAVNIEARKPPGQ